MVDASPFPPPHTLSRTGSIRRQETGLILLNLAVLAGLAGLHVLFAPALGFPSRRFFALVFGRFPMQTLELSRSRCWPVGGPSACCPPTAHVSIWLNVGFAFWIARWAGFEDSHYVVLMVIPVIAAAFRYRPAWHRPGGGRRRSA